MEALQSYFRFNLHGVLSLAAAFVDLAIGTLVLLQNSRNPVNRTFFTVTVFAFIWMVTFGMQSLTQSADDAMFWLSLGYFGVPFISPAVYQFSSRWLRRTDDAARIRIGFMLAIFIMIPLTFFTEKMGYVHEYSWGRYARFFSTPSTTVYRALVLLTFFSYALLAFGNFFRGWKQALSPRERSQFRLILLAFLAAYTGAVDFETAMGPGRLYPFGYISVTIFFSIVAYSIVRFHTFDINLMLRRATAVVLIYAAIFAFLLPAAIHFLRQSAPDAVSRSLFFVVTLGSVLGLALSLGPWIYTLILKNTFWLRHRESTGLTHELKSPITAIQGSVDIAKDKLRAVNPDQDGVRAHLEIISRNADRLEFFVNDLLSLAKIQEGHVSLEIERVDLRLLLEEIVELHKPAASAKGLAIQVSAEDVESQVDRRKAGQIISNLISNAVKFTQTGGIAVDLGVRSNQVICKISDTGIGIRPQLCEKVFDRFFQADPKQKGAGLGLAIAKGWVEAHGGRIWAESAGEGKGTTVTFTVPVRS